MNRRRILLTITALLIAAFAVACQSESGGTAEQIGKNIDDVGADARARLDQMGDAITDTTNSIAEDVADGANQVADNAKDIAKDANDVASGIADDMKATSKQVAENANDLVDDASKKVAGAGTVADAGTSANEAEVDAVPAEANN